MPQWLALGFGLAAALTALFALVFLAGQRLYPDGPRRSGTRDTEWRRRGEIRAYLRAIDERFLEDREVAGHRVAFYLPERNVAITFDAQAYFRLRNAGVYAILVEHELPGHGIGARLPFETPGWDPGGPDEPERASEPSPSAYEVLGVDRDATPAEITAAYRERVKEVHPDHGGDREQFHRVRDAYAAATERAG